MAKLVRKQPNRRQRNRLLLESLEDRQMLDAAALQDDSFQVRQNGPEISLAVMANDRFDEDYSGVGLISSVSTGSQGGRIRVADDGLSLSYTPPADVSGTEKFTYFVDDRASAEVNVEITAPLSNDRIAINPDGETQVLDVLENDPFWNDYSGERKITLVSTSGKGADVQIAEDGGSLLYTPSVYSSGVDNLAYIVDDIYPAQITIDFNEPLATDTFELLQNDGVTTLDVLANDAFWPGYEGEREITHVLGVPEGHSATIANGSTIQFEPAEDFSGVVSLRYVVDSKYETYAQVWVQAPAKNDFETIDANSTNAELFLTDNDYFHSVLAGRPRRDVVDRITSAGPTAEGGTVTITADGQGVLYTPPAGFTGSDSFDYTADGRFHASVTVSVTNPVRDDYDQVYEATVGNRIDVLENDFIGNGYTGARVITGIDTTSLEGQATIAADGKSILYTPAADFRGSDSFSYTVDGELSATASIYVQQIARSDSFEYGSPSAQVLNVLDNDGFGENYPGAGEITSVTQPEKGGTATISPDGKAILYQPGAGEEFFSYTVDGEFEATIFIDYPQRLQRDVAITDQNAGPISIDVLSNDFQFSWVQDRWGVYSGPREITSIGETRGGGIVTQNGTIITYAPPADFHGDDYFTYTVDGYLETNVVVHVVRHVRDDVVRVAVDSQDNSLNVLQNDSFAASYEGAGRITDVSSPVDGATVEVSSDGQTLIYTPAVGFTGTDNLVYTVDGKLKAEVEVAVHDSLGDRYPTFGTMQEYREYLLAGALEKYAGLFGPSRLPECWWRRGL